MALAQSDKQSHEMFPILEKGIKMEKEVKLSLYADGMSMVLHVG